MYADRMTDSMKYAIKETERRRKIQEEYNKKNNITTTTIGKEIRGSFVPNYFQNNDKIEISENKKYTKEDIKYIVKQLTKQMEEYAENLDFEKAIALRDEIEKLENKK